VVAQIKEVTVDQVTKLIVRYLLQNNSMTQEFFQWLTQEETQEALSSSFVTTDKVLNT
jgi:hypothetical protein